MGCCACPLERDASASGQKPISLSRTEQLCTECSLQSDGLQITLKGETKVIQLDGPLSEHYTVLSEDNRGEVIVARAAHARTGQKCVVTRVSKNKRRNNQKVKTSLLNTLMAVDHPHVLRTYEVYEDSSTLYIVTEDYTETLHERLQREFCYSEQDAAHIFSGVLSALHYCHQRSVVHRHINCHCLVFKAGDDKLSLGGLENAELLLNEGAGESFEAPEAKRGEYVDRSDIWSCGVVLSTLLFGIDFIQSIPPGSHLPHFLKGGISEIASDLLLAMLRRKPESRPSAEECLEHFFFQQASPALTPHRLEKRTFSLLRLNPEKPHTLRDAVKRFILFRVLSSSELWKKVLDFDSLDLNRDGVISLDELEKGLRLVMAEEEAHAHACRILTSADRNLNRVIDYSEYLISTISDSLLFSRNHLELTFRSLDRDSNGKVSMSELKSFFTINISAQSDVQWRRLIAEADTSGDGEIDFEEFERLMRAASVEE